MTEVENCFFNGCCTQRQEGRKHVTVDQDNQSVFNSDLFFAAPVSSLEPDQHVVISLLSERSVDSSFESYIP